MRNLSCLGGIAIALAGCASDVISPLLGGKDQSSAPRVSEANQVVLQQFSEVVRTVEPVAERVCKSSTSRVNCDFFIVVDDRPNQPANAFQTVDKFGRPIIAFTLQLIEDAQNKDELAFVLGHEAAHHIAGHIARQQQNAVAWGVITGVLEELRGGSSEAKEVAQLQGAQVGARTYSKSFELEADALGTVIAAQAGFDPVHGAEFFTRIPDPGDRFLGTHPPNAQRIETVKRVADGL
ncbi:MAG: M48 family metallopeptidase [Roseobacter sp.]